MMCPVTPVTDAPNTIANPQVQEGNPLLRPSVFPGKEVVKRPRIIAHHRAVLGLPGDMEDRHSSPAALAGTNETVRIWDKDGTIAASLQFPIQHRFLYIVRLILRVIWHKTMVKVRPPNGPKGIYTPLRRAEMVLEAMERLGGLWINGRLRASGEPDMLHCSDAYSRYRDLPILPLSLADSTDK